MNHNLNQLTLESQLPSRNRLSEVDASASAERVAPVQEWHLITAEYPPQLGGVSDYSQIVAEGLAAAGDQVYVWCPGVSGTTVVTSTDNERPGVFRRQDFGSFTPADLRRVGEQLDQFNAPRRLLVQWVPHGYGYRSMNLPFCFWLWWRAKLKRDRVELMVHEPFLAFGEGSKKQDLAATVHRFMLTILLSASNRVWVSIPEWKSILQPLASTKKQFDWLPVPSNISVVDDPDGVLRVRAQYAADGGRLVGHFGTYNEYMIQLMSRLLPELLSGQQLSVLLAGKGSLELRDQIIKQHPNLAGRVHGTGTLSTGDVSLHVSACDLMLQPYQDGVSGRRTSVMTALVHGVPVVTTQGKATEDVWADSRAVVLTPAGDIDAMVAATLSLLDDQDQRIRMGQLAAALYQDRFDVRHTVAALRGDSTAHLKTQTGPRPA